ncbi:MAG: hypothetical protein MUC36_12165 [Planctomycetes bacterium]|jgi:hypothetical protein|nr:hypothetical protein [Planctomycetota bacterium]
MPSSNVPFAALLLSCGCGLWSAAVAQESPADRWIVQLQDAAPEARAAARAELLRLGAAAVVRLTGYLEHTQLEHAAACLEVLTEFGPLAGGAVPALAELVRRKPMDRRRERVELLLATLAELVPHHEGPDPLPGPESLMLGMELGLFQQPASSLVMWRLAARKKLAPPQELAALLVTLGGRDPMAVEVAVERLGRLGPAAVPGLPALRALLDRAEPRLVPTEHRVPLHRKAARAILCIAPDGAEAAVAREVLAGTWAPKAPAAPVLPERLRARVDELVLELRRSEVKNRTAAADNLVALGAAAALPVAALLKPDENADTLVAALDVLRRLGKQAAPATPAIGEALLALPAPHTIGVVRALATTLPWSTDVFVVPSHSSSVGHLQLLGRSIGGTIDVAFLNEFDAAWRELHFAQAVPIDASVAQLGDLLGDKSVLRRRRALEVIAARGAACVELLPKLVAAMELEHPGEPRNERIDAQRSRVTKVDRTDELQRLAAAAILAVAPADHAQVPLARARLEAPAPPAPAGGSADK